MAEALKLLRRKSDPQPMFQGHPSIPALASKSWLKVEHVMSRNVATVHPGSTVVSAAQLMASEDISCVVAVNGKTVAGIFTERDLLKRIVALKRNPARTRLRKVMSSPVVTVCSDCSVLSAWKVLETTGIRRLVVMDDGALVGVITQTDILKAVKTGLQEEQQDYLKLLSESPSCIFTTDLDLYTSYVNRAFTKLLGADVDEFMGKPFLPERFWDNPAHRAQLLSQLQKPGVQVRELALRTAQDERLTVVLFSAPMRNSKGEIHGHHGALYNIAAQREPADLEQTQERARTGQNPLAEDFDSAADGILVIDDKGRVSNMNRCFAEIWGIPEELVCERDYEKLTEYIASQIEELPAFFAKMQAYCSTLEETSDTLHLRDGRVLRVHSVPVVREEMEVGRIWTFQDIPF